MDVWPHGQPIPLQILLPVAAINIGEHRRQMLKKQHIVGIQRDNISTLVQKSITTHFPAPIVSVRADSHCNLIHRL
jgi:hypothetical protein